MLSYKLRKNVPLPGEAAPSPDVQLGECGWVLLTPQVGILGRTRATYTSCTAMPVALVRWPRHQKKQLFAGSVFPERGNGEQRSTLWFHRQGKMRPREGK